MTSGQIIFRSIASRGLQSVLTLWLITILFFVVTELAPGDFAIIDAPRGASAAMLDTVRFKFGLNESAFTRYWDWLFRLITGDLGVSWWADKPIAPLIADRLGHSAWLFGWASLFTVPIAMILAVLAVAWRGGVYDKATSYAAVCIMSIPEFAVAYGLLILLTFKLDIFPAHTLFALDMTLAERLYASALPILSLSAVTITPMFRLARAALINILVAEYIQMAELKGVGKWRIILRHALPNAITPVANAVALALANLFFGLVIVEVIFSYPGLGSLLFTAASYRDIPLIQACGLISALVIVSLSLTADTIGLLANPRLRDEVLARPKSNPISDIRGVIRRPSVRRRAGRILAIALVACGLFYVWHTTVFENIDIVTVSPPENPVRNRLTVSELVAGSSDLSNPIHFDYFKPIGPSEPARHSFEGTLEVPLFELQARTIRPPVRTRRVNMLAFTARFVVDGDILIPVERDRLLSLGDDLSIILSPGRVWHEPADGDWSRASFPITVSDRGGPRYGAVTFLYNETEISDIWFQLSQETANWSQYDLWGRTAAIYRPGTVSNADQVRKAYRNVLATRLDIRPWSELADQYFWTLEGFDGTGNRENISASALMIDDVVYLRSCRTRAGPHPYCREMRHAVFSITKSLGAGVAMLWLAEKYGPEVFNERIVDYVSIPADHDGWANVTFGNALDMVTGIGNTVPEKVDFYVEADATHISRMVWRADSILDKLNAVAHYENYPWGPGEVFRYRTPDTTVLSAALEAYLREKEGPGTDLWDSLTRDVFSPLGIDRIAIGRSEEPDGPPGTPLLGAALYVTIDEALKIARLLQDHGTFNGKQLLHRELTKKAMSNDFTRGFPNGWRGKGRTEGHYEMSFWLTPHEQTFACDQRIPVMAGFGGNYLIVMPNRTIGLRFADGHDDDPDTWDSSGIRDISNRIRSFCP